MKSAGPEAAPLRPPVVPRLHLPAPSESEDQAPTKKAAAFGEDASRKEKKEATFADLLQAPRELWLILTLKALLSLSYFSLFNVLVLFLTDDLGLSDAAAGWAYGAHGMTVGVLSLVAGTVVDKLGTCFSLVLGSALLCVGHAMVAFASSATMALAGLLTFKSLGSALVMPALIVSLRRYTTAETRPLAYSVFYVVMNASAALSAFSIVAARQILEDESARHYAPSAYSTWRFVALFSFCVVCVQLVLSLLLRPAPVDEKLQNSTSAEAARSSSWETAKEIASEGKFWRLLTLVLLLIGVRSLFRHMDVTFPKYFLRTFGPDAPFEYFLAVNPICIIFMTPPITVLLQRYKLSYSTVFTLGATISGMSPFFLVLNSASYSMCFAFLFTLSIGEAIWSPKLYEYSVAIAPVGREASYSALSGLPVFLTTALIGGFSGHAVQHYCPAYQECDGRMLWLIIALSAVVTPVTLLVLRPWVFNQADLQDEHLGGMQGGPGRSTEEPDAEEATTRTSVLDGLTTGRSSDYGSTVRDKGADKRSAEEA